jgi:hypothetical protein
MKSFGLSYFRRKNMRLISLLLLSSVLFSCSALRNLDTTGFTIIDNTVYYNNVPTAQLEGVELSLDNNKLVREMTFSLMEGSDMGIVTNMIAYLHEKHPDYEIEVEVDLKMVGGF